MNLKCIRHPAPRMQRDGMHPAVLHVPPQDRQDAHRERGAHHKHFRTEQQSPVFFRPEQKERDAAELHPICEFGEKARTDGQPQPNPVAEIIALQRLPEDHERQRPEKTLNESIVIRIEPTAISGITDATSRHHNATRSSYKRRASRKSRALVPVLKMTAKKRMPKTVLPNSFVPSAMVQPMAGPLSRYDAARCFDQSQ